MSVSVTNLWPSVGGPAGVADAVTALDRRLPQGLFEILQLSGSASNLDFAGAIDHGDACGIVAAVFQLAQPLDDDGNNFLGTDIADNTAHADFSSSV